MTIITTTIIIAAVILMSAGAMATRSGPSRCKQAEKEPVGRYEEHRKLRVQGLGGFRV